MLFRFVFIFLLFSCVSSVVFSVETQAPIHFQSDTLEYHEVNQVIIATGHVTVQQSSYTFTSDYANFNLPNKSLKAWGTVTFTDIQQNKIRSKLLSYSSQSGSAQLEDAEGSFGSWIFAAKKITRDQEGNFFLEKAKLSTCEIDLSKYHLYGHRIQVMPKKRLTVTHALFRIGPVPVLYLPYYYYSLGEKHLAFQIFPGQSQSEGAFVRTVWGYPPTEDTFAKVYLDYLTKRGVGTGAEYNYYFGDRMKGSVYGYRIDDRPTLTQRWNTRLYHWQRLWTYGLLQMNANRMSDDNFPNDFYREDFDRVVRDLKSQLSFTYQRQFHFFRVFSEVKDRFDPVGKNFFTQEASAPNLEYLYSQTPLGFANIQKIIRFNFLNRYAGETSLAPTLSRVYRREADSQFTLLRSFSIARNTQFVPRFSVMNKWIDRPQQNELEENNVQRLITEGQLRQSLGYFLDIDFKYLFNQRLQNNQGDDHGREEHTFSIFTWFRPSPSSSIRLEAAHFLPRLRNQPLALGDSKNYGPLKGELSWNPKSSMEVFFREEYLMNDPLTGSAHPVSTQSEFVLGRKALGEDYFLLGSSFFSSRDHSLELRQSARFSFNEKLKLEGTLRTLVNYRKGNMLDIVSGEFLEKELLARTEVRCWNLFFTFRERKGVLEFLFNVELKIESFDRKKVAPTEQNQEFYPWRTF